VVAKVAESGFEFPKNPTLFIKPRQTVADTRASILIPKLGQLMCDYEGEFTILVGKDGKNISEANALDYVAGYVVGNDISCRDWQLEKDKAGMMQQWSFSKSFDQYAPLGPAIVSSSLLQDGSGLRLRTFVNDKVRQDSNTSDLLFGVRQLISFLSTGQTLEAGSLIMTGTPGGVGAAAKPSPIFLRDGDEVVVEIEKIGKLVNTIQFE
jgi:2-keto-4-pentenoate hydratase/2-oxohepta-3-ene-1,7-dioic acid hydratase in catechol pathway